jgi:hypothetical protein
MTDVSPRSDRNDGEPVVKPSPIQGPDQPTETSPATAVDSLDNAYDLTAAWNEIGLKRGDRS